ncbi:MAG: sugar phosphate isomerase/epimerase family protein [Planctomycetota bacterium]|jgi:sugar phosphate isomerase/epimerase
MKVSVSSWSYRQWFDDGKCDLLGFVEEVRRLGADGLEIFPEHVNQEQPGEHLKEVAQAAADAGLDISALIAGNDFARPTAVERAEQIERMKEWIGFAAGAGIRRMNCFTGGHTPGEDPFIEAFRVVDAYREVAPVAEQNDVVLCLENHSGVCRDADSLVRIIVAVGSKHFKSNPDPTNFVRHYRTLGDRAREMIYTETEKFAPLMANAHMKIGDFTDDGDDAHVDVPRILDIYRSVGYDDHIVLESYAPGDPVEPCAKGIALLRRLLGHE